VRALLRKALADLRTHRLQSALIVLMLFGATTALALAVTVRRGMAEPYERAFAEANGAHIWFYGRTAEVDWTPIAAMEGVTGTAGPYVFTVPQIQLTGPDGRRLRQDLLLRGLPAEPPEIGRPIVTDGRWLGGGADEIALDRNFARQVGIRTGDRVEILTSSRSRTFQVVGLTLDVGRGPFPDWNPPLAYVLPSTLTAIELEPNRLRSIFAVRLAGPDASERFTAQAYARYPENVLTGTDDWIEVRDTVTEINDIYTVLLGVFSIFALGASGFVIANAIGGRVVAQFREIGMLKAVGFTPAQVISLFLLEHLALALVATVAGIAAAALLAPGFLDETAEVFNTTPTSAFDPGVALLVLAGVGAAVSLCTVIPAWQAGRIPIVQAITTGFARVQRRPAALGRLATALRLPAPLVLGIKDTFARPVRAWLTVAALSLTVVTATFSLGMEVTLRDLRKDPGVFSDPFPVDVIRGNRFDDDTRAFLAGVPGVEAVYARSDLNVRVPGHADSVLLRAVDEPHDQMGYRVREGRMFAAPGEAAVGQGLLAMLGRKVGDEVTLTVENRPLTLRIVGRYIEGDEDGRTALTSLETLRQQLRPDWPPSTYGLRLAPGASPDAVRETIVATAPPNRAGSREMAVLVYEDDAAGPITIVRGILLGLNGVLLVIGLVNLLTTALLGVRERVRDFGIFKAVGLTPGQVMITVVTGAGLLAALAALAGIPLGLLVTRLLFDQLGEQTGIGSGVGVMPPLPLLVLLIPATVILAALASALPARRAAQVQVAEALRWE
jgi:putative ABC transport system permease protein